MAPRKRSALLRPQRLSDYIGQEELKEVLKVAMDAAKKQDRMLDHIMLNGPPGLGKTTLAKIIAREMGWKIKTWIGASIKTSKDVKTIAYEVMVAEKKMVLFIDEIHRVGRPAQEVLYSVLEDGLFYYKAGESSTIEVPLGPHTIIGATTNVGKLEQPFVDRFGLQFQMEYYNEHELTQIIGNSADSLNVRIGPRAMAVVAQRCRATPRIANNLLKRLRDYNVARGWELTEGNVKEILWKKFHLDELGLGRIDRKVLGLLGQAQGPIGIRAIAVAVGEDPDMVEARIEPYLIRLGLIERAMNGRLITRAGREHIGG